MANKDEWEEENKKKRDDENEDLNEADDSFGLPDVSYEPLNDDDQDQGQDYAYGAQEADDYGDSTYEPGSYEPPHKESKAPMIITFVVVLALVGGVLGYLFVFKPNQAKKARYTELMAQADAHVAGKKWDAAIAVYKKAQKLQPDSPELSSKMASVETEKQKEEAMAKAALAAEQEAAEAVEETPEEETSTPGTVETISSRTGRYYVVVASAVDGDLANDYANELAQDGNSPKVIEPYSDKRFYRVALADFGQWVDAKNKADELKGAYGDEVWVIRY